MIGKTQEIDLQTWPVGQSIKLTTSIDIVFEYKSVQFLVCYKIKTMKLITLTALALFQTRTAVVPIERQVSQTQMIKPVQLKVETIFTPEIETNAEPVEETVQPTLEDVHKIAVDLPIELIKPLCVLPTPVFYWTSWFDRDNPSGVGDYETLTQLIKEGKQICKRPLSVQCQTLSGIPASSTGQNVIYSPSIGCYCKNADQPDKKCDYDYKVRFGCCKECQADRSAVWTPWFDRDNPDGVGDYETLAGLRSEGKDICEKPIDMQCQTLQGVPASSTGQNVIVSPSTGCYCINSDQPDGKCNYDYEARFKCCQDCPIAGQTPQWTTWFDRDNPSGVGDFQTLVDLLKEGNKICPKPIGVDCQTISGFPASTTGQIINSSPSVGCYCVNSQQPDKKCNFDYEVRFKCCQQCPVIGQTSYWTAWFDRDDSSGVGDFETLIDLLKQGKPICQKPIDVQCKTLSGIPASATGENVLYSASLGCYCNNFDQPDGKCDYDYQVRFRCCR